MKKSLIALACLGAFAGSAAAAEVSVYGVIDYGMYYSHTKNEQVNMLSFAEGETLKDDSFALDSGVNSASRFGLKGSEDLGNGMTVSFKLENGFDADSGKMGQNDRLFGREASLSLTGNFGTFSFGRMGGVASSAGTYDIVYRVADAFDGFDNDIGGLMISDRYDNMVTYQTPEFGGVKVTAQYSFDRDTMEDYDGNTDNADKVHGQEGKSTVNRYAALAAEGQWGALNLVAAWEMQNWAAFNTADVNTTTPDDQHTFYVGGNYDFGVTKVFGMAQYFKGARALNQYDLARDTYPASSGLTDGGDGFGLHLGAQTPVAGGLLTTALYYADADADGTFNDAEEQVTNKTRSFDYKYMGVAARYEYSLSKRTTVYTGAGYAESKLDISGDNQSAEEKDSLIQAYVGLKHTF